MFCPLCFNARRACPGARSVPARAGARWDLPRRRQCDRARSDFFASHLATFPVGGAGCVRAP
eukprot:4133227-Lingulodinium_polyedra.AAC.1